MHGGVRSPDLACSAPASARGLATPGRSKAEAERRLERRKDCRTECSDELFGRQHAVAVLVHVEERRVEVLGDGPQPEPFDSVMTSARGRRESSADVLARVGM